MMDYSPADDAFECVETPDGWLPVRELPWNRDRFRRSMATHPFKRVPGQDAPPAREPLNPFPSKGVRQPSLFRGPQSGEISR